MAAKLSQRLSKLVRQVLPIILLSCFDSYKIALSSLYRSFSLSRLAWSGGSPSWRLSAPCRRSGVGANFPFVPLGSLALSF